MSCATEDLKDMVTAQLSTAPPATVLAREITPISANLHKVLSHTSRRPSGFQGLQYPLIKEYTLNYSRVLNMIYGIFLT